jgi:hypothetical protein
LISPSQDEKTEEELIHFKKKTEKESNPTLQKVQYNKMFQNAQSGPGTKPAS